MNVNKHVCVISGKHKRAFFIKVGEEFSDMVMIAVSSEGTGQWEMGGLQRNVGAIFKEMK